MLKIERYTFGTKLLDKFQAGGYRVLFIICAFAYLVGFGLNHLFAPKFRA